MFAQFSDASKTVVTAIFYSEQPPDTAEFQDQIDASDPRYKAWWGALPPGMITIGLEPPTA